MPSLLTLAAMKAYALGKRAKWKDYVDLYFIIRDSYSVPEIIKKAKDIFGNEFNEKICREQLAYFKDINYSEEVRYLKGFEVSDKIIKKGLTDFSLNLDGKVLYNEVNSFDVIYVCGGNTSYLLHKVRETNFDKIIKQFVVNGGVYVGVSAGSIIMGPNTEISSLVGDKNDIGLKDFTGLNLADIAICPHFERKDYQLIEEFKNKINYSIVPLADNQAMLILDGKIKIIGEE